MNISDWQHERNRAEMRKLEAEGFEFEITADKYAVRFKGEWVGGAGVSLPRQNFRHWKHAIADVRDKLNSALSLARRYRKSVDTELISD